MASRPREVHKEDEEAWLSLRLGPAAAGPEVELGLGLSQEGGAQLPLSATYHDTWPNGSSSSSSPVTHTPAAWLLQVGFSHRRDVGVWFCLRPRLTRGKEREALPQIPKAFIRVRDENTTVSMVKNYLVRKLGLSSDLEIDITCMGSKLLPTQTLKYVRDEVWLPSLIESFDELEPKESDYSYIDNYLIMSLHYHRSC